MVDHAFILYYIMHMHAYIHRGVYMCIYGRMHLCMHVSMYLYGYGCVYVFVGLKCSRRS